MSGMLMQLDGLTSSSVQLSDIGVRPYIELDVASLDRSIDFCTVLMNSTPAWRGRSTARFNLMDPPVTLVLNEEVEAVGRDGHLGVQLKYINDIAMTRERLEANGIAIELEEANTSCCFSVANKVWVSDPDKNLWELYVLLEQNTSDVSALPSFFTGTLLRLRRPSPYQAPLLVSDWRHHLLLPFDPAASAG